MKPVCAVVRTLAPAGDGMALPRSLGRHTSVCLNCQAEMARYGRLQRHLAALAEQVEAAPASILVSVANLVGSPSAGVAPGSDRARWAAAAAATGAVAAAGAVALAIWRQSRTATS